MRDIIVCSKNNVDKHIKRDDRTHVISFLDPDDRKLPWKLKNKFPKQNWLLTRFDDTEDSFHPIAPTFDQVANAMQWALACPDDAKFLIHCFAGVCRSTAFALALQADKIGIDAAVDWLKIARPTASPNILVAQHCDDFLKMEGKLFKAAFKIMDQRMINWLN
jgi:predicted protein tyrosine phosphatase